MIEISTCKFLWNIILTDKPRETTAANMFRLASTWVRRRWFWVSQCYRIRDPFVWHEITPAADDNACTSASRSSRIEVTTWTQCGIKMAHIVWSLRIDLRKTLNPDASFGFRIYSRHEPVIYRRTISGPRMKSTGLAIFPSIYWQIENSYLKGENDSSMRILPMQTGQSGQTGRIVTLFEKFRLLYRTLCEELRDLYCRRMISTHFLKKFMDKTCALWKGWLAYGKEKRAMKDRMRMIRAFDWTSRKKERKRKDADEKKMSGNRIRPHDIRAIFIGIRQLRSAYYDKSRWNLTVTNILKLVNVLMFINV